MDYVQYYAFDQNHLDYQVDYLNFDYFGYNYIRKHNLIQNYLVDDFVVVVVEVDVLVVVDVDVVAAAAVVVEQLNKLMKMQVMVSFVDYNLDYQIEINLLIQSMNLMNVNLNQYLVKCTEF